MLRGRLADLVPFNEHFLALEQGWRNGPGGALWMMGEPVIEAARQTRQMQDERRAGTEQGDPRLGFGIQTKAGVPVGFFATEALDPLHRRASLSVILGEREYWGQRLGTDALLLMIAYQFDWLDMRKVGLRTLGYNERVQRQMARLGARLEARQRQATYADGAWVDVLVYGLLRAEWPGYTATADALNIGTAE